MAREKRKRTGVMFSLNPVLKSKSMSKRRLAKETGISLAMICRLARKGANPTFETMVRLQQALKCSLDDFRKERRKKCAEAPEKRPSQKGDE